MMKLYVVIFTILISLFLACATVGKNFRTEQVRGITLEQTTEADILSWFGEPFKHHIESSNKMESVIYHYVYAKGTPNKGIGRSLIIEFIDGKVNGYTFQSAFKEDNTDFDVSQRNKIVLGQTTMNEIEFALGKPHGKMIPPTNLLEWVFGIAADTEVAEGSSEVWSYYHSYVVRESGLLNTYLKYLLIYFDSTDKVVDTKFFEGIK